MGIANKVRLIKRLVEKEWPEILPYVPAKLPYWDVTPGYIDFFDCPAIIPPYTNGVGVATYNTAPPIPAGYRCTPLQVPQTAPNMARRTVIVGPLNPSQTRFDYDVVWVYPPGITKKVPQWVEAQTPVYVLPPPPYYTADPDAAPIAQPAPFPKPAPYPLIPSRPDSPWPQGYKSAQPSNGNPRPLPPYGDPLAGPAVGTDGGPFRPVPPHVFMPPRKGEKEKKGKAGPVASAILNAVGTPTEAADAIDAVYDALGKKCPGAKTPQAKLKCIADNFDTLDVAKAIGNLIANEIEDRAIGTVGKALKSEANKRPTKHPLIGWGFGPGL